MTHETMLILGIPVDNVTMEEAIDEVFRMVEAYEKDRRPRQVATVNVDFMVNTLSWRLGRVRHPELIDILRRADLVTPDGMPIVWTSRLLGRPLKERVAGSDLMPRLAQEAARRGKSLYFLGGREGVGNAAASILQERFPALHIAGVDAPFVHVEGESLASAQEEDEAIIEKINRAAPHILFVGFGNPKQEIWVQRNRERLKVPVSIGVGGTYEFIIGSVARAPEWMQRTGLEWLFRITQDPKRLWKRYAIGMLKFGLMIWPAIFYDRYRRIIHRLMVKKEARGEAGVSPQSFTEVQFVKVAKLPPRLDAAFLAGAGEGLTAALSRERFHVLDMTSTSFIDSSGLGFLIRLWRNGSQEQRALYLIGVNSVVRRALKLNRLWDLLKESVFESEQTIAEKLREGKGILQWSLVIDMQTKAMLFKPLGRLDASQTLKIDFEGLTAGIGERDCVINLEGLEFMDSSGIALFLKLQRYILSRGKKLLFYGAREPVQQMFFITKLTPFFRFVSDLPSAFRLLEERV